MKLATSNILGRKMDQEYRKYPLSQMNIFLLLVLTLLLHARMQNPVGPTSLIRISNSQVTIIKNCDLATCGFPKKRADIAKSPFSSISNSG
jgi:hypothetical protein